MRSMTKILSAVALVGLAACTSPADVTEVNSVRTLEAKGVSAFNAGLTKHYRDYAIFEAEKEFEWDHGAMFARKAKAAAEGKDVAPEQPSTWTNVPAARLGELNDTRARLLGYYANGARERVPAEAALAQVKYDCWIEEEAEGETGSECERTFKATEPKLKLAPLAAPAPAPAPAMKVVKTFIIYFDYDKAVVTPEALKILKDASDAYKQINPAVVSLSGHTDTMGANTYNQKLSDRRVKAAIDELAKMGITSKAVDGKSLGEAMLAEKTSDNVKSQKNRRVEIYFEK